MDIHEYQAKEILRNFSINVADGIVAQTSDEAVAAAKSIGGEIFAIKAQIHAGGRGLGGGVKIAKSIDEVKNIAQNILKMRLITPQTPKDGKLVRKIYVERGLKIKSEFYLSFTFDRKQENIAIVASKDGGIEYRRDRS